MSRVRGGNNTVGIRVSSEPVGSFVERIDILFPLNKNALKRISGRITDDTLIIGDAEKFHGHRLGIARSVAMELCCQLTGVSQREIARHFGYKTDAGVSKQRRVLRGTMRGNPEIEKRIKKIKKKLSQSIK